MLSSDFKYATKVWLLSVLIAPFIFLIVPIGVIGTGDFSEIKSILSYWGILVLYGGLFSVPSWLALVFFVVMINRLDKSIFSKKMMIQVLCIILGVAPFFAFFGFRDLESLAISVPYLIMLSIGIWFFSLKKVEREVTIDTLMN